MKKNTIQFLVLSSLFVPLVVNAGNSHSHERMDSLQPPTASSDPAGDQYTTYGFYDDPYGTSSENSYLHRDPFEQARNEFLSLREKFRIATSPIENALFKSNIWNCKKISDPFEKSLGSYDQYTLYVTDLLGASFLEIAPENSTEKTVLKGIWDSETESFVAIDDTNQVFGYRVTSDKELLIEQASHRNDLGSLMGEQSLVRENFLVHAYHICTPTPKTPINSSVWLTNPGDEVHVDLPGSPEPDSIEIIEDIQINELAKFYDDAYFKERLERLRRAEPNLALPQSSNQNPSLAQPKNPAQILQEESQSQLEDPLIQRFHQLKKGTRGITLKQVPVPAPVKKQSIEKNPKWKNSKGKNTQSEVPQLEIAE